MLELPAKTAVLRKKIENLSRENDVLRNTVGALQQQLKVLHESESAKPDLQQLNELREANHHLILATFGAQDSMMAAEAVNARQTVFLSMLAHELRNPMASIAVANTVMESLHLTHPSVGKLLAITRRQVAHLVRLVDDLLDASRVQTGKISLQTRLVLLNDVLDSALETALPALAKRGQVVHINVPPSVVLLGDMVRLSQLFANLLNNASKFSNADATVWVTALVQGGNVLVMVKDHGRGIALEFQAGIFDLFSQGENASEHSLSGGLGIGLSLVRTIAEMHGGSVTVESGGVGRGCEFVVMLPLWGVATSALQLSGEDEQARRHE
ncbi:sensor histidine kinase [Massilia eurypsychrophila]|nr:HAMP domain-containing sensor histidine kinase [Massilia eurypsychrophila]